MLCSVESLWLSPSETLKIEAHNSKLCTNLLQLFVLHSIGSCLGCLVVSLISGDVEHRLWLVSRRRVPTTGIW